MIGTALAKTVPEGALQAQSGGRDEAEGGPEFRGEEIEPKGKHGPELKVVEE